MILEGISVERLVILTFSCSHEEKRLCLSSRIGLAKDTHKTLKTIRCSSIDRDTCSFNYVFGLSLSSKFNDKLIGLIHNFQLPMIEINCNCTRCGNINVSRNASHSGCIRHIKK